MQNLLYCNQETVKTYSFLTENINKTNHEFLNVVEIMIGTSFRIKTRNNVVMSIAHTMDTCGELETIILDANGDLDHDTLMYHDNREELLKYIMEN